MIRLLERKNHHWSYRALSLFIAFTFTFSLCLPPAPLYAKAPAQTVLNLPVPGTMVPQTDSYAPVLIRGITLNPENPLQMDFIVDTGETNLEGEELNQEARKLIKYFLTTLTVPEKDLWVNLSPYEGDKIIPEGFGQTEMGRDLLAQDYLLKQLSASIVYPEEELGRDFWQRIHQKALELYGTTDVPMNTFNKVWIVPERAAVYAHQESAYVIERHLKVMLEEDYLALKENRDNASFGWKAGSSDDVQSASAVSSKIINELVIPEIEKEVNHGKTFANLRQIYNSMILATWYKQNLKEGLLGHVYMNKNKVVGVDVKDKEIKRKIYRQYVEAFAKGVYNYIREESDPVTRQPIPRKYFSGGVFNTSILGANVRSQSVAGALGSLSDGDQARVRTGTRLTHDDSALLVFSTKYAGVGPDAALGEVDRISRGDTGAPLAVRITSRPLANRAMLSAVQIEKETAQARIIQDKLHEVLRADSPFADQFLKGGFGQPGYGVPAGAAIDGNFALGAEGNQGYYVDATNIEIDGAKSGRGVFVGTVRALKNHIAFRNSRLPGDNEIRYFIKPGIGGQHTDFQGAASAFEVIDARTGKIVKVSGEYELGKDYEAAIDAAVSQLNISYDQIMVIPSSKSGSTDETMKVFESVLKVMLDKLAYYYDLELEIAGHSLSEVVFDYLHEINFEDRQEIAGKDLFKKFDINVLAERMLAKLFIPDEADVDAMLDEQVAAAKRVLGTVLGNMFFETTDRPEASRLSAFIRNSMLDGRVGMHILADIFGDDAESIVIALQDDELIAEDGKVYANMLHNLVGSVNDLIKSIRNNNEEVSISLTQAKSLLEVLRRAVRNDLGEDIPGFGAMYDNVGGRWTIDIHMMTFLAVHDLDAAAYWTARRKAIEEIRAGTHQANEIAHKALNEEIKNIAYVVDDAFFWAGKGKEQNYNESIWQVGHANLRAISRSNWEAQRHHFAGKKSALVINMTDMELDEADFNVVNLEGVDLQTAERQELAEGIARIVSTFYGLTYTVGNRLIARALQAEGYTASDVDINDLDNPATKIFQANLYLRQPYVELGKGLLEQRLKDLQWYQRKFEAEGVYGVDPIKQAMLQIEQWAKDRVAETNIPDYDETLTGLKDPQRLANAVYELQRYAHDTGRTFAPFAYLEGGKFVDLREHLISLGVDWVLQGTGDQHISYQQVLASPDRYLPFIVSFVPKEGEELPGTPAIGFAKGYLDNVSPHLVRDYFADASYKALTTGDRERAGGRGAFLRITDNAQSRQDLADAFTSAYVNETDHENAILEEGRWDLWASKQVDPEELNVDMYRDYDYRYVAAPKAPNKAMLTKAPPLTPQMVFRNAIAWADMAIEKAEAAGIEDRTVLVARDARGIEYTLVDALISGLRYRGMNVVYMAAEGTNAVTSYSWGIQQYKPLMGIFLTASHVSKPEDEIVRGFKVAMLKEKGGNIQSLTTKEIKQDSLARVRELLTNPETVKAKEAGQKGTLTLANVDENTIRFNALLGRVASTDGSIYQFSRRMKEEDPLEVLAQYEKAMEGVREPLAGMTIVIEGSHTPSGMLAARTFEELGADVISINEDVREITGEHNADPSVSSNLAALEKAIVDNGADFGMAFDLDGDRGAIHVPVRERGQQTKFTTLAPDNMIVSLLPALIKRWGYGQSGKKLGVIRDVLGTHGVNDRAGELGVEMFQTDAGYVFLKEAKEREEQNGYVFPIYGERSGHTWLDASGEIENPIALGVLFAVLVRDHQTDLFDSRVTRDQVLGEAVQNPALYTYDATSIPYTQSPRFMPLFHPDLLATLSSDPRNTTGWAYDAANPSTPPSAVIALGKDTAVKALQAEFTPGKSYETPVGTLIVREVDTYQTPADQDPLEIMRFADVVFEQDGQFAGRIVFRASSNDPAFVASYEAPVREEGLEAAAARRSAVAKTVLQFLTDKGITVITLGDIQRLLPHISDPETAYNKGNLAFVEADITNQAMLVADLAQVADKVIADLAIETASGSGSLQQALGSESLEDRVRIIYNGMLASNELPPTIFGEGSGNQEIYIAAVLDFFDGVGRGREFVEQLVEEAIADNKAIGRTDDWEAHVDFGQYGMGHVHRALRTYAQDDLPIGTPLSNYSVSVHSGRRIGKIHIESASYESTLVPGSSINNRTIHTLVHSDDGIIDFHVEEGDTAFENVRTTLERLLAGTIYAPDIQTNAAMLSDDEADGTLRAEVEELLAGHIQRGLPETDDHDLLGIPVHRVADLRNGVRDDEEGFAALGRYRIDHADQNSAMLSLDEALGVIPSVVGDVYILFEPYMQRTELDALQAADRNGSADAPLVSNNRFHHEIYWRATAGKPDVTRTDGDAVVTRSLDRITIYLTQQATGADAIRAFRDAVTEVEIAEQVDATSRRAMAEAMINGLHGGNRAMLNLEKAVETLPKKIGNINIRINQNHTVQNLDAQEALNTRNPDQVVAHNRFNANIYWTIQPHGESSFGEVSISVTKDARGVDLFQALLKAAETAGIKEHIDALSLAYMESVIRMNAAMLGTQTRGGIDLNPELLDLQIKTDERGIPLPIKQQPIYDMKIEGFIPVIINITPLPALPMFLGDYQERDETQQLSSLN